MAQAIVVHSVSPGIRSYVAHTIDAANTTDAANAADAENSLSTCQIQSMIDENATIILASISGSVVLPWYHLHLLLGLQ